MSVAVPPAAPPGLAAFRRRPSGSNAALLGAFDVLFKLLCQFCSVVIVLAILALVGLLVWRSGLAFRTVGLAFLRRTDWDPVEGHEKFGALAYVYGTVMTSVIAMLLAVPLGVGTAAYLSEVAGPALRRVASFFIEMLAAIPSVVYGFWGLKVLAPIMQDLFDRVGGPNVGGKGMLTAGVILAIMIVPYIAAITYDVCQAVPRAQREGSLALGATRWQTIWSVVLPYCRPGIVAGCFLALGRALGETMAVTMLIGNQRAIQFSPYAVGDSIASLLANQYVESNTPLWRSVLVEVALVLMAVTVVFNSAARLLLWRVTRAGGGKPGPLTWLSQGLAGFLPAAVALFGDFVVLGDRTATVTVTRLEFLLLGGCVVFALAMIAYQSARLAQGQGGEVGWVAFCVGLLLNAGLYLGYPLLGRQLTESGLQIYKLGWALTVVLLAAILLLMLGRLMGRLLSAQVVNGLMTGVLALFVAVTMALLVVILLFLLVRGSGALLEDRQGAALRAPVASAFDDAIDKTRDAIDATRDAIDEARDNKQKAEEARLKAEEARLKAEVARLRAEEDAYLKAALASDAAVPLGDPAIRATIALTLLLLVLAVGDLQYRLGRQPLLTAKVETGVYDRLYLLARVLLLAGVPFWVGLRLRGGPVGGLYQLVGLVLLAAVIGLDAFVWLPRLWKRLPVVGRLLAVPPAALLPVLVVTLAFGLGHWGAYNVDFFTKLPGGPNDVEGVGLAHAIVGSVKIVCFATLFAVPVALLAAIYLSEYRNNWFSNTVRFLAEQLGGVPSIVIGIYASAAFGLLSAELQQPDQAPPQFFGWSAVFALAVMMLPIVVRASEEALRLVPQSLRTASFALGAAQAQTILRVTVPAALSAIVTGFFLSVARIAGETAPLLLTAGNNTYWPRSMGDYMPNLPYYIYFFGTSSFQPQVRQGWAAAFVLMVAVLALNFGIRFITGKRVVLAARAD